MILAEIPFWNKVSVDTLIIETNREEDNLFLKIYTNDVNILNKKLAMDDTEQMKRKLNRIMGFVETIATYYYAEEYDEFKEESKALMNYINLL